MSAEPAIPLFGDAYLADTHHLTLEEHGAYLKLMMIAWRIDGCALPDDDTRLANMLGLSRSKWAKLKPVVLAFWTLTEKGWTQGRLSKERAFVDKKREQNRAAADVRWNGQVPEKSQDDACKRINERNAPPPPPPKVEEVVETSSQPVVSASDVREALDIWNDTCAATGWARVIKFTPSRQQRLRARLRDDGLQGWRSGLERARASPLLNGQPPPTWFDFDFIVKPGNFAKLIEGKYDREFTRNDHGSARGGSTRAAASAVFDPFTCQDPGQAVIAARRIGFAGG